MCECVYDSVTLLYSRNWHNIVIDYILIKKKKDKSDSKTHGQNRTARQSDLQSSQD